MSRQLSNISFLIPVSVPQESLSKSFLKALFVLSSLICLKKRCPWATCTKKAKQEQDKKQLHLSVQRESNDSFCNQSSMYSVVKSGAFVPQGLGRALWTCALKSTDPNFRDKSFQICCLQYFLNTLPWSHYTVHDRVY